MCFDVSNMLKRICLKIFVGGGGEVAGGVCGGGLFGFFWGRGEKGG
ncbi:MAG: hypothetical protein Devi2KO_39970 [Devosia indica]